MVPPNGDGGERISARITGLSAVTLATDDMARAVGFYEALGFECTQGGRSARFTTFRAGGQHLNITAEAEGKGRVHSWWGRVVFYVNDVDAMYRRALASGLAPSFAPRDATWGERYFHIVDPDGHEISFAHRL